jgi:hypothetical protein
MLIIHLIGVGIACEAWDGELWGCFVLGFLYFTLHSLRRTINFVPYSALASGQSAAIKLTM